jgi:hypothetical protein
MLEATSIEHFYDFKHIFAYETKILNADSLFLLVSKLIK